MVMNKDVNNGQSRREFLGRSVAALAAASFLPSAFSCTGKSVAAPAPVDTAAEAGKVNSKFGGVQIARSLIVAFHAGWIGEYHQVLPRSEYQFH